MLSTWNKQKKKLGKYSVWRNQHHNYWFMFKSVKLNAQLKWNEMKKTYLAAFLVNSYPGPQNRISIKIYVPTVLIVKSRFPRLSMFPTRGHSSVVTRLTSNYSTKVNSKKQFSFLTRKFHVDHFYYHCSLAGDFGLQRLCSLNSPNKYLSITFIKV